MKKIIVDTNIIFSCLLNSQGTIGDLFFNSENIFDYYSNQYMHFEIRKHWNKLKKISVSVVPAVAIRIFTAAR